MKTRLPSIYYGILFCILLCGVSGRAQIAYNALFNNGVSNWDTVEFYHDTENVCMGGGALSTNLYEFSTFGAAFSPAIGTSNGGVVTFNYRYKIVDYDDPTIAIQNEDDWGVVQVYWSTDPNGEYTLLQTIDPSNHIESATCAQKSVTFQPPTGATVYLAVYAETANEELDYYVVFDHVQVTQAAPTACDGSPAASVAITSKPALCNGQSATLSLSPGYFNSGLAIQWQSSADNVNFADVPTGGTGLTYTANQTATTWYRAVVTCTASGQATTSSAVQVVSTGTPCPCEIDFVSAVEPITFVEFAGISHSSNTAVDGSPAYQDFTNIAPGQVTTGESYDITFEGNTNDDFFAGYENYFSVFIDWNHDGDFADANETYEIDGALMFSTGNDGEQVTGSIEVPENAMTGYTYMRVVKNWYDDSGFSDWTDEYGGACGDQNTGYGQAEDYLLMVSEPVIETPDWVNLQWPATISIATGGSETVYAQVWEPGVTNAAGQGAGITAWIGISPMGSNTDPATWTMWIPATYNAAAGSPDNDEYMASIGSTLAPGTYYYASRFQLNGGPFVYGGYTSTGGGFWNGTSNISGVLTVTCATAAPDAEATQMVCQGSTLEDLEAEGDNEDDMIMWYSAATGGNALPMTTMLVDGSTYYASVMPEGGCESLTRTAVMVDLHVVDAPAAENATQTFCNEAGFGDLDIDADGDVMWYADATGGSPMDEDTELMSGTTYYASQMIDGCESQTRTAVMVEINVVEMPTGDAMQEIEVDVDEDATIEDIEVESDGTVVWYASEDDAENGVDALEEGTVIMDGTYYATTTMGDCESEPFAVTVAVTLGTGDFAAGTFKYYPNPVKDVLLVSYNKNISGVEVYNIVGQKVVSAVVGGTEARIDMSQLAAGTYMVKVMGDNASKTVKVVKQ